MRTCCLLCKACCSICYTVRLGHSYGVVTNYGDGGGGASFYPYEAWVDQVLAILKGGGAQKVSTHVLKGGGGWGKRFWTRDFPILYPPLPVINDRSLIKVVQIVFIF